jgi:hypothetical protein
MHLGSLGVPWNECLSDYHGLLMNLDSGSAPIPRTSLGLSPTNCSAGFGFFRAMNITLLVVSVLFLFCGSTTAISRPDLEVSIGDEVYQPTQVPNETSLVIAEEKNGLLDESGLRFLVDDLHRLAKFMRIAYNGVGAAGPNYIHLQIKIQRIGQNVTDLFDKTVRTLSKFKTTARNVVMKRLSAYEFLADGFVELGIEILSSLAEDANEMEKAALELNSDFLRMAQEISVTVEHIVVSRADTSKNKIEINRTMEEQEKLAFEADKRRKLAQMEALKLKREEDAIIQEMNSGGFFRDAFINSCRFFYEKLTGNDFKSSAPFDFYDRKKMADMLHQRRLEQLKLEEKERDLHYKALAMFKDAARKMADIDLVWESEESIAYSVIDVLHHATTALRSLSDMMRLTAKVWGRLEDHCHMLAKAELPVSKALEYPDDKRLALWRSSSFVEAYIRQSAQWFAMHIVCKEFGEVVEKVQQELHGFIRENPTQEESRKNIRKLANEFLADIEQDEDAIATANKNGREEMEKIKELVSEEHGHELEEHGHDEM